MDIGGIETRGLVLIGCGKMGGALLEGWLAKGMPRTSVFVRDPNPSEWLKTQGVHLNDELPGNPAFVLVAVKPQMIGEALPSIQALGGGGTVFLSIAAGTTLKTFEEILGDGTPVIRAMPNTPAAVGRGITAIYGNHNVETRDMDLAESLLSVVGQVVRLEDEAQMDAVTAVSGSGPAYVFLLIETLAAAGEAQGLSRELALQLATATVAGAGALAEVSGEDPGQLRVNVTSPGGTTAAALAVLMDENNGFQSLLRKAVAAAADRGRELGK